jgi:bifunctional DNA-binding transcriptional regulator/antitoxin component of YhaV-PrlF toxin-antitoxin module
MVEIVRSDNSGRIVIPKNIRDELHIGKKAIFILTKKGEKTLLLQKIDIEEITQRLEKELAGKNVDAIVESIRKEINEKTKARYPTLST